EGAPFVLAGNDPAFVSGRLAHALGLRGPAMVVNTACSSSLVALHMAVRSLRSGETDMALAGGVTLYTTPFSTIVLCQTRALAADGTSKTFSTDADGYGRGEGCGVLVLKRLSDARRDGNEVLAVVRGTALNHDG